MTYIQITTRCNMSCEHCCFSCGRNGSDMSQEIWNNSIKFAKNFDEYICIGGGEPTLHPNFRMFLLDALAVSDDMLPFIATNGSIRDEAMLLMKLGKSGIINVALSQDMWHDPIDSDIVQAFLDAECSTVEIRNVENGVANRGRAIENHLAMRDDCACPGYHIDPDGNIRVCGCEDSPIIANVNDDMEAIEQAIFDLDECEGLGSECWKNIEIFQTVEV